MEGIQESLMRLIIPRVSKYLREKLAPSFVEGETVFEVAEEFEKLFGVVLQ